MSKKIAEEFGKLFNPVADFAREQIRRSKITAAAKIRAKNKAATVVFKVPQRRPTRPLSVATQAYKPLPVPLEDIPLPSETASTTSLPVPSPAAGLSTSSVVGFCSITPPPPPPLPIMRPNADLPTPPPIPVTPVSLLSVPLPHLPPLPESVSSHDAPSPSQPEQITATQIADQYIRCPDVKSWPLTWQHRLKEFRPNGKNRKCRRYFRTSCGRKIYINIPA